jgi:hypothetical protein
MDIDKLLLDEAANTVQRLEDSVSVLEAELAAIDQRVAEINAEIQDARLARKRLLDFRAQIGTDFQCPRCWVQSETRSTLEALPGADGEELLICRTCGSEYLIPEIT